MVKFNNSDIPNDKFAEVTIGNNGVRITQKFEINPKNNTVSIYLSKEDLMEIFATLIATPGEHLDGIETVLLGSVDDIGDESREDEILDAVY